MGGRGAGGWGAAAAAEEATVGGLTFLILLVGKALCISSVCLLPIQNKMTFQCGSHANLSERNR